jgi:hypothetical protein
MRPRSRRSGLVHLVVAAAGCALLASCTAGVEVAAARTDVNAAGPAEDIAAQSTMQSALVAAKTAYLEAGSYAGVTADSLGQIEPALTFVTGPSTGPNMVSVAPSATTWSEAVLSTTGTCFYAVDGPSGGTLTGSAKAPCSAAAAAQYAIAPLS